MRRTSLTPPDPDVPTPRLSREIPGDWLRSVDTDSSVRWCSPAQMGWALTAERARAGRAGEVFSLLVFSWAERDQRSEGVRALRQILNGRLRVTDQVGWLDGQRVGVLLPFADAAGARAIVSDVMVSYPATLAPLSCDVYVAEEARRLGRLDRPGDGAPGADAMGPRRRDTTHRPLLSHDAPGSSAEPRKHWGASARVSEQSMQVLFNCPVHWWKRGLDIVGALFGLVLFAPVMLAAMALIRIVSPGPALFKQQRAGLGGVPFTIYKLRTMQIDAEARKAALLSVNEQDGPAFKVTHDPRIIPVLGRVLRSTSLDELPQLWNVLKGDMSLVGPRPLPLSEAARCEFWQQARIDVTPGLTGPWQVHGRSRTTFAQWIRMDLAYVRDRSLLGDLSLLIRTIPAVIWRKGAH